MASSGREVLSDKIRNANRALSESDVQLIVAAVYESGYACVPVKPTKAMLDSAWADALAENAEMVWLDMIYVSEGGTLKDMERGLDLKEHFHLSSTDTLRHAE